MCHEHTWALGQENMAYLSSRNTVRPGHVSRHSTHFGSSPVHRSHCPTPETQRSCWLVMPGCPGHRLTWSSAGPVSAEARDRMTPHSTSLPGAQPSKSVSLCKSCCSQEGARGRLPLHLLEPLHPLTLQNQFIWAIFKAQCVGQLE